MKPSKYIIICADDFGQNESINQAILELVEKKRLNAVSCMVNTEAWEKGAPVLAQNDVMAGLHLNFTHGQNFPSLLKLIYQCYAHRLSKTWLEQQVRSQILAFRQFYGTWPEFIDGHQHVHQLPMIRDALFKVVSSLGIDPWFRTTYTYSNINLSRATSLKMWALLILGGNTWSRKLKNLQIKSPSDFSGDYSFKTKKSYRELFTASAGSLASGGLMMCHPGLENSDISDPICHNRGKEYTYLSSQEFLTDLKSLNVELFPH